MATLLYASCLLSISYLAAALSITSSNTLQPAAPSTTLASAAPSTTSLPFIDSSASDLGIFQLVTPTTHANQVPDTAMETLYMDVASFSGSYMGADTFYFDSALQVAISSQPPPAQRTLLADQDKLVQAYADLGLALLDNPTSYFSYLSSAAAPYAATFSAPLMSQATAILLGYESLVSQDVLSTIASFGPVTPGMSIAGAPAATGSGAGPIAITTSKGAGMPTQGTGIATSTSKGAGMPLATASPLLMVNAAAVAAGILGVALM